jgi:nucleolar protein 53
MGKKLQGAKLRAKKRAQEAVDVLQEAQAEAVASTTVSAKPDELLFVLDSAGDSRTKLYRNAVATGAITSKDTKRRKLNDATDTKGSSSNSKKKPSVDEALVAKLLQKNRHDADALQRLAKRGKDVLERQSQSKGKGRKRLHQTSSRVTYDLWQSDSNDIAGGRPIKPAPFATSGSSSSNDKKAKLEAAASTEKKREEESLASKPIAGLSVPHVPTKAKTYSQVTTRPNAAKAAPSLATKAGGASSPSSALTAETTAVVVPVEVAKGGQSYHPDPVLHTKQLEVALEVEQRRLLAVEQKDRPLATGLSEETKQYMVGDDTDTDTDSDDDNDEEHNDDNGCDSGAVPAPKKLDKLTTAQRHKQKRLRKEQAEIDRRKATKQLAHQLSEIPKHKRELNRREQELRERKLQLQALKEAQKRVPGTNVEVVLSEKDPIQAPTIPVALPSEIGRGSKKQSKHDVHGQGTVAAAASLRTIRPKGSLVLDRVHSMVDRKMAPAKNRRAAAPKKRKIKVQGKVAGPGFEIKG